MTPAGGISRAAAGRDGGAAVLIVALAVITLAVVGVWLKPSVQERLAPEPVRAWVAIEPAGSGIAEVGRVMLDAGTPFTLHAVLEAEDRQGRSVFYTRAPALRFAPIAAGEDARPSGDIDPDTVRPWDRAPHIKVRWFTVEGPRPHLAVSDLAELEAFTLETYFRPGWTAAWSIPGEVDSAFDDHLEADDRAEALRGRDFGTQRYHVRIELYADEETTMPAVRVASWGPELLPAAVDRFPTVVAELPAALGPASRVFGLSQIELPAAAGDEAARAEARGVLSRLAADGLAFGRLTVLRDQLLAAGVDLDRQRWTSLELGTGNLWGEAADVGDLLRVGERVVVLYRDAGVPGVIDYEDLCFDYVRGAAVRTLGDVFSREGLIVELQRLSAVLPSPA